MTPHTAPLAPLAGRPTVDAVLDKFVAVAAAKGLALYPAQEKAPRAQMCFESASSFFT